MLSHHTEHDSGPSHCSHSESQTREPFGPHLGPISAFSDLNSTDLPRVQTIQTLSNFSPLSRSPPSTSKTGLLI